MSRTKTFLQGAIDIFPILVGVIPFGLIVGVTSAGLGMSAVEATGASAIIFAGAAQLAAYDLLSKSAPWVVVLFAAILINLRFFLYSASIAPALSGERRVAKILYGYLLTDQVYAMFNARILRHPDALHRGAYYLGSAGPMWLLWLITTFIGAYAGAAIPAGWSLDFAIPLCFITLLIPAVRDRAQLLCVLVTAGISLLALNAPHGSGVIISILTGVGVGMFIARRERR